MQIHDIKQGTKEWLEMREGKLTGTTAASVVGYKEMLKADLIKIANEKSLEFDEKKIKVDELKALITKSDPDFSFRVMEAKFNKDFQYKMLAFDIVGVIDESKTEGEENPLERGHSLEPVARKIFEQETGKKVDEIGFVTLEEETRVGLSPDGFIKVDGKYTEGLEIKCPCAWKYIKFWVEGRLPEEYKEQVLDYFVQSDDINKVTLMIYNPKVEMHTHHMWEVTRDQVKDDVAMLKSAQINFWKEHDERYHAIMEMAKK